LAIFAGVLGIFLSFTRFARAGRILMAGAIIALAVGLAYSPRSEQSFCGP
jgi:hypothetical protein